MLHFVSSLVVIVENHVLYNDKEIVHDWNIGKQLEAGE